MQRRFILILLTILFSQLTYASAGQGLPIVRPESVGLSSERLQRITRFMESYVNSGKLPGMVALVAREGDIAYLESVGFQDLESSTSISKDTLFRIYSMTKPITTVAAMQLYEKGHFSLTDPVDKYIPELSDLQVLKSDETGAVREVSPEHPVTVRDLMTHTGGFTYGVFGDTFVDLLYREKKELLGDDTSLDEFVRQVATLPLLYEPGSKFQYSVSVDILGYLVQKLSGQPLDRYFRDHLLDPLEMSDTFFNVPRSKLDRFATCYGPVDEDEEGIKGSRIRVIDRPAESPYVQGREFLSGGGGLVSTVEDYWSFLQMMLDGGEFNGSRILGRKTVEYMTQNHLSDQIIERDPLGGFGFGLGFAVLLDTRTSGVVGSEGTYEWGGYASTGFWVDPQEKLIGILMTQLIPSSTYPLKEEFKIAVYQALID